MTEFTNIANGMVELITSDGDAQNVACGVSGNGRYVVFTSDAVGLVPQDESPYTYDAFVLDRETGAIERISEQADGGDLLPEGNGVYGGIWFDAGSLAISDDGRYVAFATSQGQTGLVPSQPDAQTFIYDRVDADFMAVWDNQLGSPQDPLSFTGGNLLAFSVYTDPGKPGFLADPVTKTVEKVIDLGTAEAPFDLQVSELDASADGRYVVYTQRAYSDSLWKYTYKLHLLDTKTDTEQIFAVRDDGWSYGGTGRNPTISDNGRFVAFETDTPFVAGNYDQINDVFIWDRKKMETLRVSETADGYTADGHSADAEISPNGRYVVYQTYSSNITEDCDGELATLLYDRKLDTNVRVDVPDAASQGAYFANVTSDGVVVFSTTEKIHPTDDALWDVYVVDPRFTDGDDVVTMGDWGETAFCNTGNDDVHAGRGRDTVNGGAGKDTLFGDKGNDYLNGGKGRDILKGGAGDDMLLGGKGDDTLYGNDFKDELFGGSGNDKLFGGSARDRLTGGDGDDVLTGGGGRDVFVFRVGDGIDTIVDFDPLLDRIEAYTDVVKIKDRGADTYLVYDDLKVILLDVDASDVTDDMFV